MKKVFIVAVLALGLNSFAQDLKERPSREKMVQMTPEQRNQLLVKKMTLDLDLNAKQQEQVGKIIAEQSAKREAMKTERKAKMEEAKAISFEMKKKILDEQIEIKNKMKSILSPEQFAKWEMRKEKNGKRMEEGRKKHKEHQRD
jgi:Spy/CpxP family protein refolding chaperone